MARRSLSLGEVVCAYFVRFFPKRTTHSNTHNRNPQTPQESIIVRLAAGEGEGEEEEKGPHPPPPRFLRFARKTKCVCEREREEEEEEEEEER